MEIPDNFKIKEESDVKILYNLNDNIKQCMPENHSFAIEVLDELLFDIINVHIIEPKCEVVTVKRV